ncbi:hypothetical protein AB1Y20_020668 [Prymnesium parvum]|uniref:ShKT domain-containing protein n=1 Tax=Prymnesium parvum TaxID=97485 RepID=A0AB34JY15_PRYPA
MARHCAAYCSAEVLEADESKDDPSCARWKEAGYCEHAQYAGYMRRSCSQACGVSAAAEAAEDVFEAVETLEEEVGGYRAEFDEAGTEIIEDVAVVEAEAEAEAEAGGGGGGEAAGGEAGENESCSAWARQGLCESEQYKLYMQQNCKQACSDPNAASAESSSATEATPANCLSWAKRGLCDSDSDYSHFMELNCKETCDNLDEARSPPLSRLPTNPFATTAPALRPTRTRAIRCEWQILKSELPPSSAVPIVLTVGFFGLMGWAAKKALARDASRSSEVSRSWQKVGAHVGADVAAGPGKSSKQNKSPKRKKP